MEDCVEYTAAYWSQYDASELRQKRLFVNLCIKAAKEAQAEGDPRAPAVLAHHRARRAGINQALHAKRYGTDGPPAQRVGLKTLSLAGDARRDRRPKQRGVITMQELLQQFEEGAR